MFCKNNVFKYDYSCEEVHTFENDCSGVSIPCWHTSVRSIGGWNKTEYHFKKEHPIGNYRADIAVLSDTDKVCGVIEVCNTHKVDEEKWQYFNDNKICCIEVKAQSIIDAYLSKTPLKIELLKDNLHLFRTCDECRIARKNAQHQFLIHCHDVWLPKVEFKRLCREVRKLPLLTDEELVEKQNEIKIRCVEYVENATEPLIVGNPNQKSTV